MVNSLNDEPVKEQECASTLLLLFYSFISFSKRVKTNFIGTISRLCIRLFLATCGLNTEMTSWYHELGENKIYVLRVREATTITWLCLSLYAHCTCIPSYTSHVYMLVNHQMKLQGQMLDATMQRSCVHFECTLLRFLQRVPIE